MFVLKRRMHGAMIYTDLPIDVGVGIGVSTRKELDMIQKSCDGKSFVLTQ